MFSSHLNSIHLGVVVLSVVNSDRTGIRQLANCQDEITLSPIKAKDIPSTGISLLRPRRHPALDRRSAIRREMLIEHQPIPVSVTHLVVSNNLNTPLEELQKHTPP